MTLVADRSLRPLLLAVCWISLVAAGCGGGVRAGSRATPRNASQVAMDPVRIQAHRDGGGELRLEAYDAESLFQAANRELSRNRCDRAVPLYDRIADEFPESRWVSASLYNGGLCLEELHQDAAAIQHYARLQTQIPDSPDVKDSLFRGGGCLERLERWPEVAGNFERVIARTDLSGDERMEALVRRATAVFHQGELDRTDALMREAILFYRHGSGADPIQTDYFMGQAQYFLGEVLRVRMEAVRFSPSESAMRIELERKSQFLLDAQAAYILAIRVTNPHWAAAAGFRIGVLFSTLYDHIMAAPVPPQLDAEQREIYFGELRRQIQPLVDKAMRVWTRTLEMGARTGLGRNEWVERAEREMTRLRALVPATPTTTPAPAPQQESGPHGATAPGGVPSIS
jgi:tetratricopeptide (TPR) repeat protein